MYVCMYVCMYLSIIDEFVNIEVRDIVASPHLVGHIVHSGPRKKKRLSSPVYGKPIVAIFNKWLFQFKESILVQINT